LTATEIVKALRLDPGMSQRDLVENLSLEIGLQHRTHQASIIRNLQAVLKHFAENNTGTDPRNEAAVNFAKKVAEIENPIPYI
jgi:hypothetical protein